MHIVHVCDVDCFQEVELLLHQLAAEQREVDTLRAYVFQERMDIAKETERVTSLARVSLSTHA